jgi:hypothetical protein
MSQHAAEFSRFDAELYLAKRLAEHGVHVCYGVTDPEIRKERFRVAILDAEKDCVIVGRSRATGRVETYANLFQRIYGEPLEPKGKRA